MTCWPVWTYRGRSRHDDHGTSPFSPASCDALDHRDELHEPSAALVAQEPVDLAAAVLVGGVHGGQHVVLDARSAKLAEPAHHLIEAAASAFGDSECVVDLARAVDRDADQEVVLAQERRPLARRAWCRWSGSCTPRADRAAGNDRRARPSGGRSRVPSASARRPATRSPRPEPERALRSAAERTSRAAHPPSGTGCPDTASPSRERSSRSSRGCTRRRSASRAGERPRARRHASRSSTELREATDRRYVTPLPHTRRRDRIPKHPYHDARPSVTSADRRRARAGRAGHRADRAGRRGDLRADHLAGRRLCRRHGTGDGGRSRDGSPTEHAPSTDPTSA